VTDSRAHPRYALEIDAEIQTHSGAVPGRTRNISHGGLSLEAGAPVTPGQEVLVTIALVFDKELLSEPLPLRGRVAWCSAIAEGRHQIGVVFVALTGDERLYVDLFLRYLREA
jgi:Tfp pilus assembly protein PilZ